MELNWRTQLTDRDHMELEFAVLYAERFAHGTSGHIEYILIAQLAKLLDESITEKNRALGIAENYRQKFYKDDASNLEVAENTIKAIKDYLGGE